MTCAEAVRAYLATLAPVTALASGRNFSPYLPQQPEPAKLPCILVQQISDVQEPHLRGTSNIKMARIQIDCVGKTVTEARTLDQAVQGTYSGGSPTGLRSIGGVTQSGVTFHQALPATYFERVDDEELHYQKRVTRDYRVWYTN